MRIILFRNINLSEVKYRYLEECDSTNKEANQFLFENTLSTPLVFWTNNQKSGRGQRGNSWFADPGLNLTFSIVINPQLNPSRQFDLNIVVSLAIAHYLKTKGVEETHVKWPNDIYVGKKKICGILVENNIKDRVLISSIIGIGFNLNQTDFEGLQATSLKSITKTDYALEDELKLLVKEVLSMFNTYNQEAFVSLKQEYTRELLGYGEERYFYDMHGEQFKGVILGVNDLGQLGIQRGSLVKYYNFQEVKFVI